MFETYRVSGKRDLVQRITDALDACGVTIVSHPDVKEAPFQYTIRLPHGEQLELVCYAFTANKYQQRERPQDEHRFQVKYGSEFHRPHDLFLDPKREIITLFFGVHMEAGIFVGADPAMHNPTWFSSSVEFKTHHIDAAKMSGWTCWERDRRPGRRRAGRDPTEENYQTEALIAFTPENMLRYIRLEQLATGLDAGERLLLAERMVAEREDRVAELSEHPLEQQFGLTAREILDVIWGRFRLGTAVRGGVAEYHLGKYLRSQPRITVVNEIDEDGRPDFEVVCDDRPFLIECKNTLRAVRKDGLPRLDFQKTRASKGDPCSRYYDPTLFDVVAACLHPVTENWEFRFTTTGTMDPHATCEGKLAQNVVVDGYRWRSDIVDLLRSI